MTLKLDAVRWAAATAMVLISMSARADIDPRSSTESWAIILYSPGNVPDAFADQQAGSFEGDFVGNTNHPSFYTAFDNGDTPDIYTDGQIAFRFRMAGDKNPTGFNGCAFVGMDLDRNGSLDVFAGINNSGSHDMLGLWWADGSAISPNTTALAKTPTFSYAETADNYSWMAVSSLKNPSGTLTDVDGGGNPDFYLSFVVPFSDFITMVKNNGFADFNDRAIVTYMAATATQPNNLNQDINGLNGGVSSPLSWASLGVLSLEIPVHGATPLPIPEPSSLVLLAIAGTGLLTGKLGKKKGVSLGTREETTRHS